MVHHYAKYRCSLRMYGHESVGICHVWFFFLNGMSKSFLTRMLSKCTYVPMYTMSIRQRTPAKRIFIPRLIQPLIVRLTMHSPAMNKQLLTHKSTSKRRKWLEKAPRQPLAPLINQYQIIHVNVKRVIHHMALRGRREEKSLHSEPEGKVCTIRARF